MTAPKPWLPNNCPVREHTGDGDPCGRCYFHLADGKTCPRHGDVSDAVRTFLASGKLTNDFALKKSTTP